VWPPWLFSTLAINITFNFVIIKKEVGIRRRSQSIHVFLVNFRRVTMKKKVLFALVIVMAWMVTSTAAFANSNNDAVVVPNELLWSFKGKFILRSAWSTKAQEKFKSSIPN